MAHFAEICTEETYTIVNTGLTISGETIFTIGRTFVANEVIRVLVVPNNQEHRGQEYLAKDLGLGGTWIQTSYNNNIRNTFAGIGYIYHEILDIFSPPSPYPSWTFNTTTYEWDSPVEYPNGGEWIWNENTLSWVESEYPLLP